MTRLNASIPGDQFEWPEFTSDRERIKTYSKKYENVSIAEAFQDVYGVKLKGSEDAEITPRTYVVGDVFPMRISSISKNNVVFDASNLKTVMVSNTNLYRFEKFKHFLPTDPLDVKVVDVRKDRITVDPLAPIMDKWLAPILEDNKIQRNIACPKTIKVKNLQLTNGGFLGKAVIPSVTNFVGEEYTVDAFIPGSQIVLNITDDFKQFVGKDVDAFVTNYIPKPNTIGAMSLICSAKEYIKFQGELNLIQLFKDWCEENEAWKKVETTVYDGEVTGVICTAKKCGVFVEIPELKVTGMVKAAADELVNYKPHDKVRVKLVRFDEDLFYNELAGQMQHGEPYVIEDGVLRKCNIKPVFDFVKE